MTAYHGHRVKDRSAKVAKRRNAMPVNGKGALLLQSIIVAKADEARRNIEALRDQKVRRK